MKSHEDCSLRNNTVKAAGERRAPVHESISVEVLGHLESSAFAYRLYRIERFQREFTTTLHQVPICLAKS